VREADSGVARRRPTGQIVAALPPGIWNITWVRDASYAIEGLLDAGKVDEAAAGLRFFLHGDAGEYRDYVGTEYLLSVVRTYGGGREESDWNAGGPNVEWDNFGLFLRAYARALEEGALLDDALPVVKHEVADVLLHLRDGTTGLLTPDSSIWETHWTPTPESKGKQTWTYSTATAVAGLRAFADALAARGDLDAARYEGAAADMANAVARELVTSSGALASNREERLANIGVLDAAVVEALNRDVLDARGAVARTTLDSLRGLRSTHTPGYFRSDEGGLYDSREWIVVDLWLSRAFRRTGNVVEAQRLLAHVTQTGLDNLGQLPELLDEQGRVAGSTPMMGFGAGAYLTALVERARDARRPTVGTDAGVVVEPGPPVAEEPRTDAGVGEGEALEAEGEDARVDAGSVVAGGAEHPEHPEEPVHDDDGAPVDAPHCSCSSSSEPTPAASLALVTSALLLLRRRRWRMR
jgi:MYXO-CTERM domain-containing protein